jgi:hypothetical protein
LSCQVVLPTDPALTGSGPVSLGRLAWPALTAIEEIAARSTVTWRTPA